MPFEIVRNDITRMHCDAIVNAAKPSLLGGGGVDGAIHAAAGPELLEECRTLGGCHTGDAKITRGYKLPAKYVIHTVGPVWQGGTNGEEQLLTSCYRRSLEVAVEYRLKSVAFPLISAGIYGYPKDQALTIARRTITDFLQELEDDIQVYLVVYDRTSFHLSTGLQQEIAEFIDEHYIAAHPDFRRDSRNRPSFSAKSWPMPSASKSPSPAPKQSMEKKKRLWDRFGSRDQKKPEAPSYSASHDVDYDALPFGASADFDMDEDLVLGASADFAMQEALPFDKPSVPPSYDSWDAGCRRSIRASRPSHAPDFDTVPLEDVLKQLDESFSESLLRRIDERGMTDAQCYKKANVDRKLFSKIRNDRNYRPSKVTAIAFAIALELSLPEMKDLLGKAGYALSRSSKFDVIIEYFISRGNYDIFEINEALFAFDQVSLV